jgi:hypothetical protein
MIAKDTEIGATRFDNRIEALYAHPTRSDFSKIEGRGL